MHVQETFIDRSRALRIGETDVYEAYTDDLGKLYRDYVREYGRCTGKVYIDSDNGPKAIGWVFLQRTKYDDCNETFLRETWVTLHDAAPERTVTHHYHELKTKH